MLHYRKYPIEDVPLETEELTKWMYERFTEKEHMLEHFYKTGKFPVLQGEHTTDIDVSAAKCVGFDWRWVMFLHMFFCTNFCVLCYSLSQVFGAFSYLVMVQ